MQYNSVADILDSPEPAPRVIESTHLYDSVHLVSFADQQLSQLRAVLTRDPRCQSSFHRRASQLLSKAICAILAADSSQDNLFVIYSNPACPLRSR